MVYILLQEDSLVFIIQISLLIIFFILRGRFLFGKHLTESKQTPERLDYIQIPINRNVKERHVGLRQSHGIPFFIRSERWYHRVLKAIGIAVEIKVQNQDFDKKYFIATDFPNHLERAISSGDLLKNLQDLFALPIKSLHAAPNAIWCVIEKKDRNKPEEYFTAHLQILKRISEYSTSKTSANYNLSETSRHSYWAFFAICVHLSLFGLGFMGMIPGSFDSIDIVNTTEWFITGILLGGVFAGGWLFLNLLILKRTPWICWFLTDFILFGVIGFLLSGIWIVRELNDLLPQPPATEFTQHIVKRECVLHCASNSRRSRVTRYTHASDLACAPEARASEMQKKMLENYKCSNKAWYEFQIYTSHWKGNKNYGFPSSQALFDQTQTGSVLQIPVNQGALGLEWVDVDKISPE